MSFRQFGGLQYAARNNIVSNSYNTNSNLQVTGDIGQPNSYINFLSDISGNIILYGDLNVTGDEVLTGNLNVGGNQDLGGNLDVSGNVTATNMFLTNTNFSNYTSNSVVTKAYVNYVAETLSVVTGQGLNLTNNNTINVSNNLNFIQYIDNSGATLNLGTVGTISLTMGSSSCATTVNGATTVTGTLSAQGGITTTSGSFTNVTASQGITGVSGSFTTLNTSQGITATGTITASQFNATSDYRVKENARRLDETFSVDNLIPVTYINKNTNKQDVGLIAHELQEIYPFLVNGEKDGPETQSINYTGLIGILIKEIQDLKKEIKLLQK
jgi:hypothetical protein